MLERLTWQAGGPLVALLGDGRWAGDELALALQCPFRLAAPGAVLDPAGAWPGLSELAHQEPGLARTLAELGPGAPLPAAEAERLGVVDRVVPAEALRPEGEGLIHDLVGQRDEAQAEAIIEAVDDALSLPMAEALGREADRFLSLARRRFGPAHGGAKSPTSPRAGAAAPLPELAGGGSGWGNFPPPQAPLAGQAPVLRLERDGALATLLLDDPPRNEMDDAFFARLGRQMSALRGARGLGAVVVRGARRHFSSGADLEDLGRRLSAERDHRVRRFLAENIHTFQALATLPASTVAAVGGCCLGSGLELALACGRRLAADNAVLALPEAQYGLMPGCGGTVRLPRLVGRRAALELILSGRSVMAPEALALGLVDAVLPRKELVRAAERQARQEEMQ